MMLEQATHEAVKTSKTSHPLRVGVLGCGYWGPKLARNFNELADSELTMACDFRADRLSHIRGLYPQCQITSRYADLLEAGLDAIVIATPVNSHYGYARAALEAGKHVLVEKPITASAAQALELVRLAESRGKVLMVGHTFEYNPAVEAVRRIIASGELGEIYYINCVRVNLGLFQPDINVMWDLAPHDISILNFVLQMEPVAVSVRGRSYVRPNSSLHEVAFVALAYPNGVLANIRVSWIDPIKMRQITVTGSHKMLVYDDIADDKLAVYDKGPELPAYSDTEQQFRMSYRDNGKTSVPITWMEPLRQECQHFVDCIRTGATPRTSGEVGLRVVKTLESAQKSLLNEGLWVPVGL